MIHFFLAFFRLRQRSLLISLFFMFLSLVTACSTLQFTPVTPENTGFRRQGLVVWYDLITEDVVTAQNFYAELFGWKYEKYGGYVVVLNGGMPIGGMVEKQGQTDTSKVKRSGGWISYFSMDEIDQTAEWVERERGKVLRGPGTMAKRGRFVTIADPQGAPLVLLQSESGDPVQGEIPMGSWLWNELWTNDLDAALSFYQRLAGYGAELVTEKGEDYWVLTDAEEEWRAGIRLNPFEGLVSQWVPVVRVADPIEVVTQVSALGGRVLIDPGHPLSQGSVALIKDPTGAILMVESWQPETKVEEQ